MKRAVLDLDVGTDDALALLLMLEENQRGNVILEGITCVNGNTTVQNVCTNVIRLLRLCNRTDVPVYKGAEEPIISSDDGNYNYFHGRDGMGDLVYEDDTILEECLAAESAVEFIGRITREKPGEIDLICLGPLTNIALAMKVYPHVAKNAKGIYLMGGNYNAVGNVTKSAEFNFHMDPEAANIVLQTFPGIISILPWEACLSGALPAKWREDFFSKSQSPAMQLVNRAEHKIYNMQTLQVWRPCDVYLVAFYLEPKMSQCSRRAHSTVELHGRHTRGQMVIDHLQDSRENTLIVEQVDVEEFKALLWNAIP